MRTLTIGALCAVILHITAANAQAETLLRSSTPLSCEQAATTLTGDVGTRIEVDCPACCTAPVVWGSGPYTDDSSICGAAVHAGVIPWGGGSFVIEIGAGQSTYEGTTANDVTTAPWGEWGRSFAVLSPEDAPTDCYTTAQALPDGASDVACPSGCREGGAIWGTDVYSDDSSICRAALHAGVISGEGGVVTISIEPGREAYEASVRNDIESLPWAAWARSFRVRAADDGGAAP